MRPGIRHNLSLCIKVERVLLPNEIFTFERYEPERMIRHESSLSNKYSPRVLQFALKWQF
jgi:hypothetical protein